jgi:RNA methyltransferase, TrmH family
MPLSAREQKLIRALRRRKERIARSEFVAEGVRVVEDLLGSRLGVSLLVVASSAEDSERVRVLRKVATGRGVAVREVDAADFAALADTESPQGVLAVAASPRHGLEALAPRRGTACLLVLDAVQDPGNFGTLVRTAEALGADGVVTLPGTVDPWNAKSVRSAVGASFRLPIVDSDWGELRPWLTRHGFEVLAADAGGEPLPDAVPPRSALVVGNEGAGVSAATFDAADRRVAVPIRGRAESLNVAAAAAILLHHLIR